MSARKRFALVGFQRRSKANTSRPRLIMRRILVQSSLCHMALSHKWIIRLPPSHTAALHRRAQTHTHTHTHQRSFQHKPRLLCERTCTMRALVRASTMTGKATLAALTRSLRRNFTNQKTKKNGSWKSSSSSLGLRTQTDWLTDTQRESEAETWLLPSTTWKDDACKTKAKNKDLLDILNM